MKGCGELRTTNEQASLDRALVPLCAFFAIRSAGISTFDLMEDAMAHLSVDATVADDAADLCREDAGASMIDHQLAADLEVIIRGKFGPGGCAVVVTFQKVAVNTMRSIVAGGIRKAILEGALQSGERIVERKLAAQFEASLSVIREALVELEMNGVHEEFADGDFVIGGDSPFSQRRRKKMSVPRFRLADNEG